jgi:Sulfotransferase family
MGAVVTKKIRFLHVPKTGGSWAVGAMTEAGIELRQPKLQVERLHPTLDELEPYSDRFTIAFVRHPLGWWRSEWRHRMRVGWETDAPDPRILACRSNDFNEFIEMVAENIPGYLNSLYSNFVGPPERPISFVGRYERLVDDLVTGLRLAGEDFDETTLRSYEPVNIGDPRFRAQYTPELEQRLVAAEQEVIDRFYPETSEVGG